MMSVNRAGNWWKITARNQTAVHYGEPLQTVVINCNTQLPDARNNRHKPNRTVSNSQWFHGPPMVQN